MKNYTYDQLRDTNLAFASKAYRNGGEKAPITVMYECHLPVAQTAKQRMVSRALNNNLLSRRNYNLSYKVEKFEKDFGIKADTIVGTYKEAIEINKPIRDIYGEDLIIRRIDTIDEAIAMDEHGKLKSGWSIKSVNGVELTFEGALIYSTTDFGDVGEADVRIKQDQSAEMMKGTTHEAVESIEAIQENKVNKKEVAVEPAVEIAVEAPF